MVAPDEAPRTRKSALRASPKRGAIVLVLGGRIARADVPRLCERFRQVIERTQSDQIVCDVGSLVDPDAVAVDALARMQLTARRLGRRLRLRNACAELCDLLALMGLRDVIPLNAGLGVEAGGQAEERENPRRVEKEADSDDLAGG